MEELFILEHSPYYSIETEPGENGMQKAKSISGQNKNDALRVLQTVSLYLTDNLKQDSKDQNTYTNNASGMQKAKSYLTVKIFGKTITLATFYFPSGTLKVKGYHTMNKNGAVTTFSTETGVPIKGIKIHFLTWFYWGHTYTDENGYYEAHESYLLDPIHTIYFSGQTKDKQNSWDLDRVWLWGSCLWVQKHCLGEQSKDNYDATIGIISDAWEACITNNAFYEYMTICDKEGLTRPPSHLQVALREKGGASSAPLFQNHTNYYTSSLLAGFFTSIFFTDGAGVLATAAYIAFLNSLPDILISGGNLNENKGKSDSERKAALNGFYSTIWHELTHASHFQRVRNEKGYGYASDYWNGVISTEVGHSITSLGDDYYGTKGDSNWQQIALVEGWAHFIQRKMSFKYINYDPYRGYFPWNYYAMYNNLLSAGCSFANIEKSLNAKTLSSLKLNLKNIYPALSTRIDLIVKNYE